MKINDSTFNNDFLALNAVGKELLNSSKDAVVENGCVNLPENKEYKPAEGLKSLTDALAAAKKADEKLNIENFQIGIHFKNVEQDSAELWSELKRVVHC
eukprot:UN03093